MSGRRLRKAVANALVREGVLKSPEDGTFVIAGLTNAYASYTTTWHEYQQQRYEGGSTAWGPHQTMAFEQEFSRLATDMARGVASTTLAPPQQQSEEHLSFIPPVLLDTHPKSHVFGDVLKQPGTSYMITEDKPTQVVEVIFQAANPRNNVRRDGTFLAVERLVGDEWVCVATDNDLETKFHWKHTGKTAFSAKSMATIEWTISADTMPGTYRIRYFGTSRTITGHYEEFTGTSKSFSVRA